MDAKQAAIALYDLFVEKKAPMGHPFYGNQHVNFSRGTFGGVTPRTLGEAEENAAAIEAARKPKLKKLDGFQEDAQGNYYTQNPEPIIVKKYTNGDLVSAKMDISYGQESNGDFYTRYSTGNAGVNEYKKHDSANAAVEYASKLNEIPNGNRSLKRFVKENGTRTVAKYPGTDIYGKPFSAGEKVYYYKGLTTKKFVKDD